jgi:Vacuolar sorting-associated protein 13, N-terminal
VPGCILAAGLTVKALEANTCDAMWMPGYVAVNSTNCTFKLVELSDAALYWDSNATLYGNLPPNLFAV